MSVWNKIDSGLTLIYTNFLNVRQHGVAVVQPLPVVEKGGRIFVALYYTGDLRPVIDAGFQTIRDDGHGRATGTLLLEDLPAITDRDEVISIHYGRPKKLHLDISIPQIKANQVWSLGPAPNFVFGGNPGTGVIVGIIDTGADIQHPFLWAQTTPTKKTRILRIWDMGLVAAAPETPPVIALLEGGAGGTYGVEYKDSHINDVLNGVAGAMPVRHRDCAGHGTHVASIAAGDGRFAFVRIGVAPRADLVIVKLLNVEKQPQVGGVDVNPDQMFKDAVTYIRKFADSQGKAVAINFSAGGSTGAHDGFDESDDWLTGQFADAVSAGKIFVASAGNEADPTDRQHATIVFSAASTKEIPFEVFDDRVALSDTDDCPPAKDNTEQLLLDIYYPNGGATLKADLKPQGEAAYTAGPALGLADVTGTFSGRTFKIINAEDQGKKSGATVKRNNISVIFDKPVLPTRHLPGTYMVKLTAGGAMTVHAWCSQNKDQGVRVATAGLPAGVTQDIKFTINSPGCDANVIAVAAYSAKVATLDVADFSSRGPVPRHGVGGAAPAKPDIGAPGVKVHAAKSADVTPVTPGVTIAMSGTSMAAPHVTGAVALLLQKKKTLTPSQVLAILQTNALKVPAPVAEEMGGGRLDAKNSFDNIP